jgi:glucosamine kinase
VKVLSSIVPAPILRGQPSEQVRFVIGVDGGGTHTRARLADRSGRTLAQGQAGPSALGQGVVPAWTQIVAAVQNAAGLAGTGPVMWSECAVGAGLSGASAADRAEAFLAANPGCALLALDTDGFVALLGAHAGQPGALMVSGTGSVGEALDHTGRRTRAGGWGWVNGDEGSGAWLGREALRHAERALDGRDAAGPLARALWAVAGPTAPALLAWQQDAGQARYASLAPRVFEHEEHDTVARGLVAEAVHELEALAQALDPQGALPLALQGSVALRLAPRFSPRLRQRLVAPLQDATSGALAMALHALDHGAFQ